MASTCHTGGQFIYRVECGGSHLFLFSSLLILPFNCLSRYQVNYSWETKFVKQVGGFHSPSTHSSVDFFLLTLQFCGMPLLLLHFAPATRMNYWTRVRRDDKKHSSSSSFSCLTDARDDLVSTLHASHETLRAKTKEPAESAWYSHKIDCIILYFSFYLMWPCKLTRRALVCSLCSTWPVQGESDAMSEEKSIWMKKAIRHINETTRDKSSASPH